MLMNKSFNSFIFEENEFFEKSWKKCLLLYRKWDFWNFHSLSFLTFFNIFSKKLKMDIIVSTFLHIFQKMLRNSIFEKLKLLFGSISEYYILSIRRKKTYMWVSICTHIYIYTYMYTYVYICILSYLYIIYERREVYLFILTYKYGLEVNILA